MKLLIAILILVPSTALADPNPPQEGCGFLPGPIPACHPCHFPNRPNLPPGWGYSPHGEIIRCPY